MSSPSLPETLEKYIVVGFWGLLTASIFLGCTFVQGYNYFHSYNDRWHLKTLVFCMIMFNTMSWAFLAKLFYFYLVQSYNNELNLTTLSWEYSAETVLLYTIQLIAQLFFARQIYLFNRRSSPVALIIVLLAVCGLGFGIEVAVLLAQHPELEYTSSKLFRIIADISVILPAICDIVATASMWIYLGSSRTHAKSTKSTVKSLKFMILNRGLLLAATEGAILILWITASSSWYWLAFHMNLANIYVNTMLVMLNERANIREKGKRNEMISLELTAVRTLQLSSSRYPDTTTNSDSVEHDDKEHDDKIDGAANQSL